MHCHCGTNNRAPRWTFTDPCKPEVRPGAREESASPAWLAAPAINARDTTKEFTLAWLLKINRVPPLIIRTYEFEYDCVNTVVRIVSISFIHRMPKLTVTFAPLHTINRVPSLIVHNLHAKFESVPKLTDLWNSDPKSRRFLFLSSITCMWSLNVIEQKLNVIGQKLKPYRVNYVLQSAKVDLDLWTCHLNNKVPPHPQQLACDVWKWFDQNCTLYPATKFYTQVL